MLSQLQSYQERSDALAKSGCSASVSWEQPINNRAIITGYRLEMAQVSDSVEEIVIVNLRTRRRWNHLLP